MLDVCEVTVEDPSRIGQIVEIYENAITQEQLLRKTNKTRTNQNKTNHHNKKKFERKMLPMDRPTDRPTD